MIDRIRKYMLTVDDCEDIAQVILNYQSWVDPDENSVDAVMLYAKMNGYTDRRNKSELVDNRLYLFAYLMCKFSIGPQEIAKLFKMNHSTVSSSLGKFEDRITDRTFLNHTMIVRDQLPLNLSIASDIIKNRRRSRVHRTIVESAMDDVISLVDSLIKRDGLLRRVHLPREDTWKRYFLFNELQRRTKKNEQEIAKLFKVNHQTVSLGIRSINDKVLRSYNKDVTREYEQIFRNL